MIKINLIKEEVAPVRKKVVVPKGEQQKNLLFFLIFIIACGAMGYFYWNVHSELTDLNRNIRKKEEEKRQLEGVIEELHKYEADKDLLRRKIDTIEQLANNRYSPVELLVQLQDLKPENLWFTKVNERGGQVTIDGRAASYSAIAEFDGNLVKSRYFIDNNVELLDSEELPGGEKKFTLTCRFTIPPPLTEEEKE